MFADFATGGTAFDNYAYFDTDGDGEIGSRGGNEL